MVIPFLWVHVKAYPMTFFELAKAINTGLESYGPESPLLAQATPFGQNRDLKRGSFER